MTLTTETQLAQEYIDVRLKNFKALHQEVQLLVLNVAEYYLMLCYPTHDEALLICEKIQQAQSIKATEAILTAYQAFLEFLPLRLRGKIQGQNLYRQPTVADSIEAKTYLHNLPEIKLFSESLQATMTDTNLELTEQLKIIEYYLNQSDAAPKTDTAAGPQI